MQTRPKIDLDTSNKAAIAYRYIKTIAKDEMDATRGGRNIKEFFIPTLNICFNKYGALQSEKYRNTIGSPFLSESKRSPLTKVVLSKELVKELEIASGKIAAGKVTWGKINRDLTTDRTYKQLFYDQCVLVKEINESKTLDINDGDFQAAYQVSGNEAILLVMLKYVLGEKFPQKIDIDYLVQIINKLDSIEKKSLKDSLTDEINEYMKKSKTPYDDKVVGPMVTPAFVGATSGVAAMQFTENSLVGIGVGLFTAGLTFFGRSYYQQSHSDQKKEIKQIFFDLLSHQNVLAVDDGEKAMRRDFSRV